MGFLAISSPPQMDKKKKKQRWESDTQKAVIQSKSNPHPPYLKTKSEKDLHDP